LFALWGSLNPISEHVGSEEIRAIILSTNEDVRNQFLQYFSSEVDSFIANLPGVYDRMQAMAARVPYDRRSAWADEFLFTAFNSLLTSFHLLISGFNVPSGNLMRHYAEAVAMALLLSHRQIDTFSMIDKDPQKFSVHKAMALVMRNRTARLLGVDGAGWQKFKELTSFYDQYSYPSVFAVSSGHIFSSSGYRQMGSEFDTAKLDAYRKEISLRISAAQRLYETVEVVEKHLVFSKPLGHTLDADPQSNS
jgi:hypothetical protein